MFFVCVCGRGCPHEPMAADLLFYYMSCTVYDVENCHCNYLHIFFKSCVFLTSMIQNLKKLVVKELFLFIHIQGHRLQFMLVIYNFTSLFFLYPLIFSLLSSILNIIFRLFIYVLWFVFFLPFLCYCWALFFFLYYFSYIILVPFFLFLFSCFVVDFIGGFDSSYTAYNSHAQKPPATMQLEPIYV